MRSEGGGTISVRIFCGNSTTFLNCVNVFVYDSDTNIMDNMLKKMESYAKDLEDMVEARTAELQEEKQKSERLLLRLLPK